MVFNMTDLSAEAMRIHEIFQGASFTLATVFILISVVTSYFKLSFFDFAPAPSEIISRAFIAFMLIYFYGDIANTIATVSDSFAEKIGSLNQIDHVLSRMGDKLETFSFSWTSIKDSIVLAFSFLTFFLLYISVFIANAGTLFAWIVLYVLSPFLIVLYIFPETAPATKGLFRSLIEVSLWKVMWAILAALLWSSALGTMNENAEIHFLTVVSYNIILSLSVLATPLIVHMLVGAGLSAVAAQSVSQVSRAVDPTNIVASTIGKAVNKGQETYTGNKFNKQRKNI